MAKNKIVIVGGGFGGVKAALMLAKDDRFAVQLVSDKANFRYYPSLYHTATGGTARNSSIPLKEILPENVELIEKTVVSLDKKGKLVLTDDGQKLPYDSLILALGVVTNYFGIQGLSDYSYGIKSSEEVERLKAHLHKQIQDEHKPDLNYVIVGAGPTGIELAGSLPDYLRHIMKLHGVAHKPLHVDLIEAAPRLLPRMPRDTSRAVAKQLKKLGIKLFLGQTVQGETADELTVNGKPVRSHTVIWTAGVSNHPFFKENNFTINIRGKVMTDVYLQAEDNIYVIGDNANTPYSGLAQTALYDGVFVAHNLRRQLSGKTPRSYRPKRPITVIPAGHRWAAVNYGQFRLYGWIGWMLREAADLIAFHDYEPWWKAGKQWLTEFETQDSCPVCAAASQSE